MKTTDQYTRKWIIERAIPIVEGYGQQLTVRTLYYRLVADHGMTNSMLHCKRVIAAMAVARWDGSISFDSFLDHEREVVGYTAAHETDVYNKIDRAEDQINAWMSNYSKNRWENQPIYPEVWIEKKALQGVFDKPCNRADVALCPCKGYPSLTFLNEASARFDEQISYGKEVVMLYFGDYDPSGEDIPRSIVEKLGMMGTEVTLKRIALTKEQVIEWKLPPAPTKITDSRSHNWDGLGQVELDAIEPNKLAKMVTKAINELFNEELGDELTSQESKERTIYVRSLKEYVANL